MLLLAFPYRRVASLVGYMQQVNESSEWINWVIFNVDLHYAVIQLAEGWRHMMCEMVILDIEPEASDQKGKSINHHNIKPRVSECECELLRIDQRVSIPVSKRVDCAFKPFYIAQLKTVILHQCQIYKRTDIKNVRQEHSVILLAFNFIFQLILNSYFQPLAQ